MQISKFPQFLKFPQLKRNQLMVYITVIFLFFITVFAVFWFFHSAPPGELVITTGPKGSMFERYAEQYQKILSRNGIKLRILTSEGSVENLTRLTDKKFKTDIGFVQGGITKNGVPEGLVSLGSVSYEPLYVFYRGQ